MAKNWHEVKAEIEQDIDRIWWEEPEEVKMCRLGIFPSGANVDGQVLGNLFFLVADTQAMGWWTIEPAMRAVIADTDISLDQCKRIWKYLNVHMASLMGATDPPRCPAPWLNLPKMLRFCEDIVESFDSIQTKEEFADLNWSWVNYVNRLNKWFALIFPWHLGKAFPLRTPEDIAEMARLADVKTEQR